MKFLGCIMAAVCLLLVVPGTSFAARFPGLTITQILAQDDQGHPWPDSQIASLMVVKPGDIFLSESIRQGISYLYLTGRFRDIRVDAFPDKAGVKLVYTLVPITAVEQIVIRGNHALSTSRISDNLRGVEGRELREDRFPDYRTAILTLYQSEGYYGASIGFKVEQLKQPHRVALYVYIEEPGRTVIEDVNFSGNTAFTKKDLIRAMKSQPGKPLRTDVLFDQDLAAIAEKYSEAGYPAAKPGPVNISFRDNKAYILIEGKEGPKVSVAFSGNHEFSDNQLKKQILIWPEHDISDAIVDSSVDKIKNIYKDDGYDNVKVTVKKAEAQGRLELVFDIQEGKRVIVKEIILRGNSYFPLKKIKRELSLGESGWFSSSPFRQDLLDKDVEYLRERYLEAGFLAVDIKKKVDFADSGVKAVIQIDINEGPQTLAGSISFEGNHVFTENELLEKTSLKSGAPYSERLADEDRYHILSAYSDKGYLYVRVEAEKRRAGGVVDITYTITEDQPVRIGKIILRGNERTKESVIMREILLKPGDSYDYEKILKSQQRIYRFGYFNLARFEPVHPGEKEYVKDMLLTAEERPAGAFEFGVGYGDLDRARAFAEISHRNMWGLAHYAGVRYEKSDILDRAIMNYQHPWFFGYDLQGKFALTWSDLKHINSDTREIYYQTRQTSASYGVEKKMDQVKASLTYAYENVENYNVEQGAVLSPEDAGHVRISSLSPSAIWDLRDDIFNPRKGALYGVVLKQALHQLESQADFTKVSVQASWYIPLTSKVITAFSARGGIAWPHYQTTEIPLHERFYLGGNTTVRGYTQDRVGPTKLSDGTITPTGGSSMWQLNAEVRLMPTESFGFVLFSDAGRVWIDQRNQLLPADLPPDVRPPARASYGAGIRYGTPVGPLRIDYGQKIHRRPGESPGELHFNIGHTF